MMIKMIPQACELTKKHYAMQESNYYNLHKLRSPRLVTVMVEAETTQHKNLMTTILIVGTRPQPILMVVRRVPQVDDDADGGCR